MPGPLPSADLEHVFERVAPLWDRLRGKRLFLTGGTGFFGCWLLESFALANDRLQLGAAAVVLTRDPAAFEKKGPHLAGRRDLSFHRGDMRDFEFPAGEFPFVIHAATETRARLYEEDPKLMFESIVEGTRRTLEFARRCGALKFLLTSSGAVYGPQPPELPALPEDFLDLAGAAPPATVYGEAKRESERMCAAEAGAGGMDATIARCFAFVGPHLALDGHFAIGNFIRDAMAGGPIRIQGDGTPLRSYLHAADLAAWLWKILFDGVGGRPYNVGGAAGLSIAQTAAAVRDALDPRCGIIVAQQAAPGKLPARFVPDTGRARSELGLREWIGLDDAIRRTARWHKA